MKKSYLQKFYRMKHDIMALFFFFLINYVIIFNNDGY